MQSHDAWLVVLLALCAANLPFVNQRVLGVLPRAGVKPVSWRLLELLLCYVLVGALAMGLEWRRGQVAAQGWEFYAITGALFLTFAFPGFVFRYLFKRRH